MSNLIIPGNRTLPPQRQEIKLPPIEIPAALKEDLDVNKHLEKDFYMAVGKALDMSLSSPDTALREVTVSALKERIELAYTTVVILRREMNYSLKKCFDVLPKYFMQALAAGEKPADLVERAVGNSTAWARGEAEKKEVEIDTSPEADLANAETE